MGSKGGAKSLDADKELSRYHSYFRLNRTSTRLAFLSLITLVITPFISNAVSYSAVEQSMVVTILVGLTIAFLLTSVVLMILQKLYYRNFRYYTLVAISIEQIVNLRNNSADEYLDGRAELALLRVFSNLSLSLRWFKNNRRFLSNEKQSISAFRKNLDYIKMVIITSKRSTYLRIEPALRKIGEMFRCDSMGGFVDAHRDLESKLNTIKDYVDARANNPWKQRIKRISSFADTTELILERLQKILDKTYKIIILLICIGLVLYFVLTGNLQNLIQIIYSR